jgi:two-component system, sensor histidine kinase and response regulator
MTEHGREPLILVADDIPANVELLFDQLHTLGYRTIAASDGPSALEVCFREQPDLCILDVAMPARDLGVDDRSTGFEVCRRIKRDPRTARIPVIFVTALNDTGDRVKAIEAGGDDFLTKPHNRLVLGARVRSLLRLKAVTDALDDSYRKLRELEKLREDLMRMLVHDLKTPLTSVVAVLEMVGDGDAGPVTEQQRALLSDAETKAEDLLALIEDLLEVAKLEDTALELEFGTLSPAEFFDSLVSDWSVRFRQDKTVVNVEVSDDAPSVQADVQVMRRVFGNLIQNALTHSPHPVQLELRAKPADEGVLFSVGDDGPGIPEEYHEVIFHKFRQLKSAHVPRARSSGLGLAFCKLAVEAHGGRIWVRSSGGKGSVFYVSLPISAKERASRTPRSSDSRQKS